MPALIRFIDVNPEIQQEIIRRIRQAITSQDHVVINYGAQCIYKFLDENEEIGHERKIPKNIVSGILKSLFRTPNLGLSTLLDCAKLLASRDQFDTDEIGELAELLDDLSVVLNYSNIAPGDPRGIGAPMARLKCIALSKTLLDKGFKHPILSLWSSAQSGDPLPEIRHANFKNLATEQT